jgi:hypothetical protein
MNQTNTENQLNFVIFSPAFQAHVGGVIALHNLARIIDEAGFPCKIFDMNGLKIPNSIFEKYGTEADVNKKYSCCISRSYSWQSFKCKVYS